MDATCERRRGRYHRPGPWLQDLRRLVEAGLSDRQAARELSRLYPGLTFTKRCVRYWRHQRLRPRDADQTPAEERQSERRAYQWRNGWGHLLPRYDEDAPGRWVGVQVHGATFLDWCERGAWSPGHELTPAEVRVLSALRDHGPLTRQGLARALGLRGRNPVRTWRGRSRLARLARLGLVLREGHRFRLTPAATRVDENPK